MSDQQEANAENSTQLLYHACFNDILTEYPAWSTDTNDIENTNPDQYRSCRQEILTAWQLHDRLGLAENSLLGAQTITVAMVQSDQLSTKVPN